MAGYLAGDVDEWIYIDVENQHPDSMRFVHDCEKVLGKEIKVLKSHEEELQKSLIDSLKKNTKNIIE